MRYQKYYRFPLRADAFRGESDEPSPPLWLRCDVSSVSLIPLESPLSTSIKIVSITLNKVLAKFPAKAKELGKVM